MILFHLISTLLVVSTGIKIEKYTRANLEFSVTLKHKTKAPTLVDCFDICQQARKITSEVVSYSRADLSCQYGKWQEAVMATEDTPGRMIFLTGNKQIGCVP